MNFTDQKLFFEYLSLSQTNEPSNFTKNDSVFNSMNQIRSSSNSIVDVSNQKNLLNKANIDINLDNLNKLIETFAQDYFKKKQLENDKNQNQMKIKNL